MSFMTQSGPQATTQPKVQALRVQGARYGAAVTLAYGTVRLPLNYIWVGDFVITQHPKSVGKGGEASTMQSTYSLSMEGGVCRGPITGYGKLWLSGNPHRVLSAAKLASKFDLFLGTEEQAPWSHLVSTRPGKDLAYTQLAYIARNAWKLGSSSSPPQANIEVRARLLYDQANQIIDAEPSAIVTDLLTNENYGAGFDGLLGDLTEFRTACIALGMFISPVLDSQRSAAEWLAGLLELTLADVVWVDGLLQFKPYYDSSVTANGVTFTPNLTPVVASSSDDDYLITEGQAEEPILVTRRHPADRHNEIRVEYTNRANSYKTDSVSVFSQADIESYQLRPAESKQMPAIMSPSLARIVGALLLERELSVMNEYKFKLPQTYIWLRPLDIWPLTDANLGLSNLPVRITEVNLNEAEELEVTAEDLGECNTPIYPVQATGGAVPPNGEPDSLTPVNTPSILEPYPAMLPKNALEIWVAPSGQLGNARWGGANIWLSEDGSTYKQIGQQRQSSQQGVLLSPLAAYSSANPDNTNTLSIDLDQSQGEVESMSAALVDNDPYYNLAAICAADGSNFELLSFTNVAAGASDNQYDLTRLNRGLFKSTGVAHAAGEIFALLGNTSLVDGGVFRWSFPARLIGKTIYFKFTSFEETATTEELLSDATAYSYFVRGRAAASATTRMWVGTGPMLSFSHLPGDIVVYPAPALRGQVGIVCLIGGVGAASVWAEFGYIDAVLATQAATPTGATWPIESAPAIPTSGSTFYSPPSAVLFSTPAVRGSVFGVNVVSGPPGTWEKYGVIDAITIAVTAVAGPLPNWNVIAASDVPVGTYSPGDAIVFPAPNGREFLGKTCISGGSEVTSTWAKFLPPVL